MVSTTTSRRHTVVARFDCHPEQAFLAQRRIWPSRAKRRVSCDAIIACLARYLTKLHHYLPAPLLACDTSSLVILNPHAPSDLGAGAGPDCFRSVLPVPARNSSSRFH